MYKAREIAQYILHTFPDYNISNLKLQKLLYYVQAHFLLKKNEPCFQEEMLAWDFGPVTLEVYNNYKIYGANEIPRTEKYSYSVAKEDAEIVDAVVVFFGKFFDSSLTALCQAQKPFKTSRKRNSKIISLKELRDYFKEDFYYYGSVYSKKDFS